MTNRASRIRERLTIDPDESSLRQQPAASNAPTADSGPPEASKTLLPDNKTVASAPTRNDSDHDKERKAMPTALDDPALLAGRKAYRSFYVDDHAFGRFRAAIYWASRRPDAVDEVPENMSVAINDAMINLAAELEQRFNGAEILPPTPEQRKSKRTKPS
jgi:hypothetical protein